LAESTTSRRDDWGDALRRAAQRGRFPTLLFLEEREDLVVEVPLSGEPPRFTPTRAHGLSATLRTPRGSRLVYLSAPRPEDASDLAGTTQSPAPPTSAPARTEANRRLAPAPPIALMDWVAGRIRRERTDVDGTVRWIGFAQEVVVATRDALVHDRRQAARIRVDLEWRGPSGRVTAVTEAVLSKDEARDRAQLDSLVAELMLRLEQRRDTVVPAPGRHDVVFGPGVGGILIHELVGHALEADTVLAHRSWLTESSALTLPRDLTVIDDPRRGRAAWRIDDEGQPSRPAPLLRDGAVAGWLQDASTSGRSGRSPTGHGRRASFREPVRPRMGCTFLAAGRYDRREILGRVRNGIYVRRMEAASTDPQRGRATFRVTDADRILDGRLDAPLRAHVIHVDGPAALSNLGQVGDDLAFDTCVGSCHRDGQAMAVSVGAPTICIGLTTVAS